MYIDWGRLIYYPLSYTRKLGDIYEMKQYKKLKNYNQFKVIFDNMVNVITSM